jgi:hypothetical protein
MMHAAFLLEFAGIVGIMALNEVQHADRNIKIRKIAGIML